VVEDDVLERALESALRRVLDRRPPAAAATDSELETRFLQLVRDAGLPQPQRQYEVRDGTGFIARIDFAYRDRRLAIELDGFGPHADRVERDRTRQNPLVLLGWTILRLTWADVVEGPASVVSVLRGAAA
jgi:very-short-patch-repair endonuclease